MVQIEQTAVAAAGGAAAVAAAAEVLTTGRARATKAGVKRAPLAPGCYLFKDADGAILYIGKSVALRQRLASYFLPNKDRKTRVMIGHAHTVEWRTVGSEVEALILESQLVKQHQPPYNVQLRDYPHYTFLRFAPGGGFPHLEITSGVEPDGGSYYGPFWGKRSAEQTMEFVNRLFALRSCAGNLPSPREGGACFYAQIHRCAAPCLGRATRDVYAGAVRDASDLMRGDVAQLIARLERQRDAAAEELRYEHAARLHEMVTTLRTLQGKRKHLRSAASTVNFLVVVRQPRGAGAQVLAFSAARLRGQVGVDGAIDDAIRQTLEQFVLEHYPSRRQLAIDLDELDQMHVVAEWLAKQGRSAVYVPLPDGPLTPGDAQRAVDAVAQALAN
jgi:excinuclease UvrABC nuclease subunit